MTKIRLTPKSIMIALLGTMILIAPLTACQEKRYHIGVSQCLNDPWRKKVNQEMQASQFLYNNKVEVSIASAGGDTERQIQQIDSFANAGIDLLVVSPNQYEKIASEVEKVMKQGIPVIFYDRETDSKDYTAFIGGDNEDAGKTMGQYALSLAKGMTLANNRKPVVLELTGGKYTSPAIARHKGFKSVLAKASSEVTYRSIDTDWSDKQISEAMRKELAKQKPIDIVFCPSDQAALVAHNTAKAMGKEKGIKFLGIDGLAIPGGGIEAVEKGILAGTYIYPTHGERVVELAINILNGQQYKASNKMKDMLVTPQNAKTTRKILLEVSQENEDKLKLQSKLETYSDLYSTSRYAAWGLLLLIVLLVGTIIACIKNKRIRYAILNIGIKVGIIKIPKKKEIPRLPAADQLFIDKVYAAIQENMGSTDLKVDVIGEAVHLSRAQLYRKVKALTGMAPNDLIRQLRLEKAAQLLEHSSENVSEVATSCGFASASYFVTCFKKQYGISPGEYKAKAGN